MRRWVVALLTVVVGISDSAPGQDAETITTSRFADVAQAPMREASARVESIDQAVVSAEVAARVVDIPVRVGETVDAGALLVRLDDVEYRLGRQAAEAQLELAEAGRELARIRAGRARRLAPDRFVSDDQLLEAETRLRQAEAELAAARVELERADLLLARTEVRSPYAAVVQKRLIGAGALAAPSTPLLELVAVEQLEITSGIARGLVEGLRQSRSVAFLDGDERYPVRLLRVSPLISPGARQREARFEFVDDRPAPGSQGTIAWIDPRPVLPADFVVRRGGELGVLLIDTDGAVPTRAEVRWRPLPQADAGRPVQVDLPLDTLLVADGRLRVQPGQTVILEPSRR
jgi:RND family efflux transporter MFP subunit